MQAFIEKHGASKVFKWGYCLLAVLLIAAVAVSCLLAVNITFGGERLRLDAMGKDFATLRDSQGREMRLQGPSDLMMYEGENRLTYGDMTIIRKMEWEEMAYHYQFSNGSTGSVSMWSVDFEDLEEPSPRLSAAQQAEVALLDTLLALQAEGSPVGNRISMGLLGLLLLLLGVGLTCMPEAFWRFQTRLIVQNGEPTEWALFSNRVSGIFFILFAFVVPFLI